ncbi:hypothetical protein CD201_06345 [Hafnia alvei]|uniref:fimbria/pilus outer membrane usher protein n=1 Tax=Hafnia TaxID=568 RepID=UPI000BBAEA7F|nr:MULTISPECIES: fimbria/pilus outer membrane usher protein [Hafnia]AWV44218.1 hypothetical protein CD201_06345 [Hafnia alvei]
MKLNVITLSLVFLFPAGYAKGKTYEEKSLQVNNHEGSQQTDENSNAQKNMQNEKLVFNTSFIRGDNAAVDIDTLLNSGVLPGDYDVSIYLNSNLKTRKNIKFVKNIRTNQVEACLTPNLLNKIGIDVHSLLKSNDAIKDEKCVDLKNIISDAYQSYDAGRFRLSISIPQVYLKQDSLTVVDTSLWDYGIAAAFTNYNLNVATSRSGHGQGTANSLSSTLNSGVNMFGWRYRNSSSVLSNKQEKFNFSSFTNFVEHDLEFLKAQLRIGDVFAVSRLLDGFGIRGIQLSDDLAMQANGDSTLKPIIRGVAETNATVEIRQMNFLLYTEKVPPGPFMLTDINPAGTSGDLEVKIIEADGREKVTIQPWGSNAYMVRKNFFTYDLSAGKYNQYSDSNKSLNVINLDYTYGLAENLSILGGAQVTKGYYGLGFGLGTNTPFGPVALDIEQSSSKIKNNNEHGTSIRFSYNKLFDDSGTSLGFISQRFSTEGFRTLSSHAQYIEADSDSLVDITPKLSTSISLNQNLNNFGGGSIYLSLSDNRYWNNKGRSSSISSGYNNNWGNLSYSISLTHSSNLAMRGVKSQDDTSIGLNISMPLGSSYHPITLSSSVNHTSDGKYSQTASANQSLMLLGQQASYSLYSSGTQGDFNSIGANLNSQTPFVSYSMSASKGEDYTNAGGSFTGGIITHSGGVNFTPGLNETVIIADVAGIEGVEVNYSSRTGTNGYAVIPSASPYTVNQVLIGKNVPGNIELNETTQTLVPRRGAIVEAHFLAKKGRRVEFLFVKDDSENVPFGATVNDEDGEFLGITDPKGKSLVLLPSNIGRLKVHWDKETCYAEYNLGPEDKTLYFEKVKSRCHSQGSESMLNANSQGILNGL